MQSAPDARETASAGDLTIKEVAPGFNWLGLQVGTLSFDPLTHLKTNAYVGFQGGRVFDGHRFGLTFEAVSSHPKSDLLPGQGLAYSSASLTHLTGFSDDPGARFWPYFGQGLGAISVPRVTSAPTELKTVKAPEVHASLGFLHRPSGGFIWGLEGRYVFAFSNPDLKESRGSLLVGYTWGGRPRVAGLAPTPSPVAPTKSSTLSVVRPEPLIATLPVTAAANLEPAKSPTSKPQVPPAAVPTGEMAQATAQPVPGGEPLAAPRPMARATQPPVARPEISAPPVPQPAPAPVVVPIPVVPVEPAPLPARPVPAAVPAMADTLKERPTGAEVDRASRLHAIRQGDLAKAVVLSRSHINSLPAERWTLQLEVASLPSTLKNAVEAFPGEAPDLFIAPLVLSGGKTAYQLFLADYPSKVDAERAAKSVPALFLEGGQRPRVVPVSSLLLPAAPPSAPRVLATPPASAPVVPALPPSAKSPSTPAAGSRDRGDSERVQRLGALRQGDFAKAAELGRKHVEALPAGRWTLRLEIATLPSTLKTAVEAFPGKAPDLFIVPIKLRSGKPAYQVLLSDYASREEAEQAAGAVPRIFLEGGQRPKPLPVSSLLLSSKLPGEARSVLATGSPVNGAAPSQPERPVAVQVASKREGAQPRPLETGSYWSHPAMWIGGLATLALILGVVVWRRSSHLD